MENLSLLLQRSVWNIPCSKCFRCDRQDKVVIYGAVVNEKGRVSPWKRGDTRGWLQSVMMGPITGNDTQGERKNNAAHTHTQTAFHPDTMSHGLTCHRLLMTVNVHRFVIFRLCGPHPLIIRNGKNTLFFLLMYIRLLASYCAEMIISCCISKSKTNNIWD